MPLNTKKIETSVQASAANQGVGIAKLIFRLGERIRLRFIGGENEPHEFSAHWYQTGKRSIICAQGHRGAPGCVACHYQPRLPGMGGPQPRMAFTVIVDRWVHIRIVTEGQAQKRDFQLCQKPKPCDFCRAGVKRQRENRKYWDLSGFHVQQILAEIRKLERRCAACEGLGMLETIGYYCTNSACGQPDLQVPEDPSTGRPADRVLCPGCRCEVTPAAELKCSRGCPEPRSRDITDCWVAVTKTGTEKKFIFSFDPEPPSGLDGDDALMKPFDFRVTLKPRGAQDVANLIGLPNPWPDAGDEPSPAGGEAVEGDQSIWDDTQAG